MLRILQSRSTSRNPARLSRKHANRRRARKCRERPRKRGPCYPRCYPRDFAEPDNMDTVRVFVILDDRSSPNHPLGDAVETFLRREDAERFIEEVRGVERLGLLDQGEPIPVDCDDPESLA